MNYSEAAKLALSYIKDSEINLKITCEGSALWAGIFVTNRKSIYGRVIHLLSLQGMGLSLLIRDPGIFMYLERISLCIIIWMNI